MADDLTMPMQCALDDYWAAKTPSDERKAYSKLMETGFPDAYAPVFYVTNIPVEPSRYGIKWVDADPLVTIESVRDRTAKDLFAQWKIVTKALLMALFHG